MVTTNVTSNQESQSPDVHGISSFVEAAEIRIRALLDIAIDELDFDFTNEDQSQRAQERLYAIIESARDACIRLEARIAGA